MSAKSISSMALSGWHFCWYTLQDASRSLFRCETCGFRYHQRCSPRVPIRCSYVDEDILYATYVSTLTLRYIIMLSVYFVYALYLLWTVCIRINYACIYCWFAPSISSSRHNVHLHVHLYIYMCISSRVPNNNIMQTSVNYHAYWQYDWLH